MRDLREAVQGLVRELKDMSGVKWQGKAKIGVRLTFSDVRLQGLAVWADAGEGVCCHGEKVRLACGAQHVTAHLRSHLTAQVTWCACGGQAYAHSGCGRSGASGVDGESAEFAPPRQPCVTPAHCV